MIYFKIDWCDLLAVQGTLKSLLQHHISKALTSVQFSSVAQSCPTLCDPMNRSTPGLPVHHQLQDFTQTQSIELVMSSIHLILCLPLLPPSIFPSIRVFSNESVLRIRWPKYWRFSFSISPSNEHPGRISFRMDDWISLQSKGLSRVFSNTTVQKHQFFGAQLSSGEGNGNPLQYSCLENPMDGGGCSPWGC